MKKHVCVGCSKESKEVKAGLSFKDIEKKTGFYLFFDQSNGLTHRCLCPDCYVKARDAAKSLLSIVKTKYIAFANFAKDLE